MPPSESESLDWDALFARYEAMAVGFVRGLIGDEETARDLYQEAARATYERASTGAVVFEGMTHARNYLFQVLRNLAVDWRSGRHASPGELDTDPADPSARQPLQDLARDEARESRVAAMRAAWRGLPARDREVLHLRYLEGKTYKEMAMATGRSISTLQARVTAGLARLRDKIGKTDGAE